MSPAQPPAHPTAWTVRPLRATDLPALMRVQVAAYGEGLVEPEAVQAQRLREAPDTVWGAFRDGQLGAYLMAYRTRSDAIGALHLGFAPDPQGNTLYLHDLAVHPEAAGQGLGSQLVAHALAHAQALGLQQLNLVAVQGSQGFWQAHGWAVLAEPPAQAVQALASYGPGAQVLTRLA